MSEKSRLLQLESWEGVYSMLNALTLHERGMAARICKETGVQKAQFANWLNRGVEPKYSTGMKLRRWLIEYYGLEK